MAEVPAANEVSPEAVEPYPAAKVAESLAIQSLPNAIEYEPKVPQFLLVAKPALKPK
jgi:hypothetical protein